MTAIENWDLQPATIETFSESKEPNFDLDAHNIAPNQQTILESFQDMSLDALIQYQGVIQRARQEFQLIWHTAGNVPYDGPDTISPYARITQDREALAQLGIDPNVVAYGDGKDDVYTELFYNPNTRDLRVVFSASNFEQFEDIDQNYAQYLGHNPSYYRHAIKLAESIHESPNEQDLNLVFLGQSLAGGLSSASAIATGREAYVFNPAVLHPNTVSEYQPFIMDGDVVLPQNIHSFIVHGDLLYSLHSERGENIADRIALSENGASISFFGSHPSSNTNLLNYRAENTYIMPASGGDYLGEGLPTQDDNPSLAEAEQRHLKASIQDSLDITQRNISSELANRGVFTTIAEGETIRSLD